MVAGTAHRPFTSRVALWQRLEKSPSTPWDMIVVGGGITGAGILREAARLGLKALLIEQRDFAWGTSSRSSKMVHGGLRYLASGQVRLTMQSLHERERLLEEAPGLIERMGYLFFLRKGRFPGRLAFGSLLTVYDRLAGIRDHRYASNQELERCYPGINSGDLKGACYYTDTVVDDARLVLRVIQEAIGAGGQAGNYMKARHLIKTADRVSGVVIEDVETGRTVEASARVVVNATGAWADRLRNEVNPEQRIRPLRGSHLVFPCRRLPAEDCLTVLHPDDKRPVYIFPWEDTTVVGTTDLDHPDDLDIEASITGEEVDYLLTVIRHVFPGSGIGRGDVISTWAGVRPVIGSDRSKDPSRERRDHAVWSDQGLVTVSGGKLAIFRLIALDAIRAALPWLDDHRVEQGDASVFDTPLGIEGGLMPDEQRAQRLGGRYGEFAGTLLEDAPAQELELIDGTRFCLAECRWAARRESVLHLDDLLLRRTRLGLILPRGGECVFGKLREICMEELGWDAGQWDGELDRYLAIWKAHYSLPEPA